MKHSYSFINISQQEKQFNEYKKRFLLIKYHKKHHDRLVLRFEKEKLHLMIIHEELKQRFLSLHTHIQLPRNILQYIGSVLLCENTLNILKEQLLMLMTCINEVEGLAKNKHIEYLECCLDYHKCGERLIKLDFKIRNRLTIINNYEF